MKKIIFILTLLLAINIINVSATNKEIEKKLVLVEGKDYNNYLEYEGYEIIENNVDFNNPGLYSVIYQNKNNKDEIIKKNVEIINKTESNDIYINTISKRLLDSRIYKESVIIREYYLDYEFMLYNLNLIDIGTDYTYFQIKQNNQLIRRWQVNLIDEIKFYKLHIYNDSIFLIGTITNETKDIYILNSKLTGETINELIIPGSGEEKYIDSLLKDNYLYITGITNSKDSIFTSVKDEDAFILKYNTLTNNIVQTKITSLKGIENISNIVVYNNQLVFFHTVFNDNKHTHILKTLNGNLEDVLTINLGNQLTFNCIKLQVHNDELFLLLELYNEDINRNIPSIYKFQSLFSDLQIYNIIDENYFYYPLDIVINEDNVISILLKHQDGYEIVKYYDNKLISKINFETTKIPFKFIDDGNVLIELDGNHIYETNINSIIVDKSKDTVTDNNILNYLVLINSKIYKYIDSKSKLNYQSDFYGKYFNELYFTNDDLIFIYNQEIFVKDIVNVAENNVYDIGIKLKFNGIGYLNDQEILSNYEINNEGKYQFKLIGVNNEELIINFEVKNLTLKEEVIEPINANYKLNIVQEKEELNNNQLDIVSTENNKINNNKKLLILIIPFVTALSVLFTIFKFF